MLTTFLRRPAAVSVCAALLVSAFPCVLAGQAAPPPAAPPPGSAATFKSAQELAEVLKKAGAHAGNTELHYIIEGSGTIVTGGTIVKGPGGATITYLEVRWLAPVK